MASNYEVAEAKASAQVALFKKIENAVEGSNTYVQLETLARAYRYAAGGAQPGGGEATEK